MDDYYSNLANDFRKETYNTISKVLFQDKKACPVCGSYTKFEPFGGNKRENAKCPECFSLERDRAHWLIIISLISSKKPISILHVNPETCIKNRLGYTSDIKYSTVSSKDLNKLPFENESFDLIICNYVLQEVDDDKGAVKEISRVLKREGSALLSVPINAKLLRTAAKKISGKPRVYGTDYKNRLESAGLSSDVFEIPQLFEESEISAFGLNPEERITIYRKSVQ